MSSEVRPPIETRAFAKQFGSVRALDGMDLTVHAGEVHGFLGPNGAGKTTTLRILRVERATWWPSEGALQAPATPRSDPAARRSALGRVLWLLAAGVITTEFADLNSRRALLSVMVISPPLIAVRGLPQGDGLAALLFFTLLRSQLSLSG